MHTHPSCAQLRPVLCFSLTAFLLVGTAACGDDSPAGNNNTDQFCDDPTDCPSGYDCVGNVCVEITDAGTPDAADHGPNITLSATELDFGTPLIGYPVPEQLQISNTGDEDLTISSIELDPAFNTVEFEFFPDVVIPAILPPNQSFTVDVRLIADDDEEDEGRLLITSNDPDEPLVTVWLRSEMKGDDILSTCVMESADYFDPCVTNPYSLPFGDVLPDNPTSVAVTIFNSGSGNQPLVVYDIHITNNSGYGSMFQLEVLRLFPEPGNPGHFTEEPLLDFPNVDEYLTAISETDEPEALLARVTFEAATIMGGRPIPPGEFLIIDTSYPVEPSHQILFTGNVLCPDGYYDIDGDPGNGCEYQCTVSNGGIEICDGVDNDCNGETDEGCPDCGNGVVDAGEQCDDGANGNNCDGCLDDCTAHINTCGDGYLCGTEQCDDGANGDACDGCLDDCTLFSNSCGDNFVCGTEQCDDGANGDDCDGCLDDCTAHTNMCGDGIVCGGEACDDGANGDNCDGCLDNCTAHINTCGDGFLCGIEQCDDGANGDPCDGCLDDCMLHSS
ncbi:choice-of-anchor D domain-containing protein [Myxococcota bacterium]